MFWKLVWRRHADDCDDRICPRLRLLLRASGISVALCSRGGDGLSACERLRHMWRLRHMRRWRRDIVLRAATELTALQGVSADLRSGVLNLRDGLLCACSVVRLRELRLFKLRMCDRRLFDVRRRMRDMRLRACGSPGIFKLRWLCIGRLRRCSGAGDEPGLFRRAGRCSDTELPDAELSDFECVVSDRGDLCDAGPERSAGAELQHADLRWSDLCCSRAIGGRWII